VAVIGGSAFSSGRPEANTTPEVVRNMKRTKDSNMRTRFALLAGAALASMGVGFAALTARSSDPSALTDQRSAASAPQKLAATSMVVYKSAT
jgi:hypothetical protein